MAKKKKPEPLTEAQVFARLKKRYAAPEYAIFPSVQNTTGFARQRREADAIAMGLWPSRGMELSGFEIKSRRSDWLGELRQPKKSEAIQRYCNRWWIVVGEKSIVNLEAGELPPTWGLMVPRGKDGLVTVVEAPLLETKPLDRGFVAAILRRAQEASQRPDMEERIREELRPIVEKQLKDHRDFEVTRLEREVERVTERLKQYEKASESVGLKYQHWKIEDIAKAIKYFTSDGPDRLHKALLRQTSILDGIQVEMKDALEELERMKENK